MNQDISSSDPRSSYSQSERLIQIGTYLQQVREDQGLSIEQVATKTMIAARHIRAIEAGTMNVLPEAVYIRGFIKRYAEVLGLDGTEISTAFPLATDEPAFKPTWQNSDVAQLRQTHLYLAYVTLITLAVIGLGAVLVRLDNGDRPGDPAEPTLSTPEPGTSQDDAPPPPPDSPTATDVTENPETSEEVDPAPTNEDQDQATLEDVLNGSDSPRPVDPAIADKPVRVQLEMKERSWLRVTVDGQLDFEGVLDEGTQRTWAGETNVLVRVGNAGGVLAAFNESEAEIMGDPGSVQERLFSPDSADPADSTDSAEPD